MFAGLAGAALAFSAPAAAEDCAVVHEIAITHTFEPGDIYAKVGECIHFTNIHVIEHSAVGLDREFNTGILMPGGTSMLRFDEPIVIPYTCGVHPPMVGVLIIEAEG
jgi:plastocyanin